MSTLLRKTVGVMGFQCYSTFVLKKCAVRKVMDEGVATCSLKVEVKQPLHGRLILLDIVEC